MPVLREWMLHYPSDWTAQQARSYLQDIAVTFNHAIGPVVMAVGPHHAAAMLLTLVLSIARANPVYGEDIKNGLAAVYDQIESFQPAKGRPN